MDPVPLGRFTPMAAAGAAALGIIFGASNLPSTCLIVVSARLRRVASARRLPRGWKPLPAALGGGGPGWAGRRPGGSLRHARANRLVVVCPCIVLVPGPHLLDGSIDLMRARIPIGEGRIGFAMLTVLAICGGLLAGVTSTGTPCPQAGPAAHVPIGHDTLAAGVAFAAYGSFFDTPRRLMAAPVVVGIGAHAVRWLLLEGGASLQPSAFAAAALLGMAIAPLCDRLSLPFGASVSLPWSP